MVKIIEEKFEKINQGIDGVYSFFNGETIIIVENGTPALFNGDGEDLALGYTEEDLSPLTQDELIKLKENMIEAYQMSMGLAGVFTANL